MINAFSLNFNFWWIALCDVNALTQHELLTVFCNDDHEIEAGVERELVGVQRQHAAVAAVRLVRERFWNQVIKIHTSAESTVLQATFMPIYGN